MEAENGVLGKAKESRIPLLTVAVSSQASECIGSPPPQSHCSDSWLSSDSAGIIISPTAVLPPGASGLGLICISALPQSLSQHWLFCVSIEVDLRFP